MSRRGINKATSCKQQVTSRQATRNKEKETNMVRHCGLDPQSPSVRREASRLYISGDSDLRQNDGYCCTATMSRRGLNMYNPLQAKRSWGYRITPTLSELRSSSIYRRSDNADFIGSSQIRKKICGHLFKSASSERLSDNKDKRNKIQTYDAFIAETRYFASHGVYCVDGIDAIDDTYNVYDWETRNIASLRNTRQNINLQKSHGFDGTDAVVETRCFASHHAPHHAPLFPSLRGTKQSSVSCFWIASYLAMTEKETHDEARDETRSIASLQRRFHRNHEIFVNIYIVVCYVETRCFASPNRKHYRYRQ
jgi:hypothetical protein